LTPFLPFFLFSLGLNGSGNSYGFDESRILKMMLEHGFKTYSYNPINRTLINPKRKNLNSGNTLFIRDELLVMEKLRNSPKVTINGQQI
jgi:hypothetical protein